MGLFSKKTVTCTRCGKKFETRIAFLDICDECTELQVQQDAILKQKEENVKGYVQYAKAMKWEKYSAEQLDEIAAHKAALLNQCSCENGISKEELKRVSDNYSSLSDQQAMDILQRVRNSTVNITGGAGYNGRFFVPLGFEGTIVDAQDVFAVGIASDSNYQLEGHEALLCVVFTNDPYIPVFPMVILAKLGFFEITHSKKGRKGAELLFEILCPNLTYPVQNISKLKKQIKQDGYVNGKIPLDVMLAAISKIPFEEGIFKKKFTEVEISESTGAVLKEMGYMTEDEIKQIMRLNKMFPRDFWNKIAKKLDDWC